MAEITVDLSHPQYPVFNTNKSLDLPLMKTNFIYGRNGTGKSTLVDLIAVQHQNDFDVRLFTGMDMYLEDKKLNAVLLGQESRDKKIALDNLNQEIAEIESKLKTLEDMKKSYLWEKEYIDLDIEKSKEFLEVQDLHMKIEEKETSLLEFLTATASTIKHINTPQIVLGNYNRNNLKKEIEKASMLHSDEINRLKN
ncbi:MAG: hypothetical protein L0I93_05515, partial [Atopostipes suicloacalis]|nr:hypothetical protein [Atopostipes suicloacalis]